MDEGQSELALLEPTYFCDCLVTPTRFCDYTHSPITGGFAQTYRYPSREPVRTGAEPAPEKYQY